MHHSDRGSQYCGDDYQALLREYGMLASMSRKGNCRDNAPIESLFNSLKDERVHTQRHTTRDEARQDIFKYIEAFYNRSRRHSALGYVSPHSSTPPGGPSTKSRLERHRLASEKDGQAQGCVRWATTFGIWRIRANAVMIRSRTLLRSIQPTPLASSMTRCGRSDSETAGAISTASANIMVSVAAHDWTYASRVMSS
jgi:hypothetical protein